MADLSKKEWEKYEKLEEANVFKNIATVMHKGIQPVEVAEFYDKWADDNNQYEKVNQWFLLAIHIKQFSLALAGSDDHID
jgi:hypothetical protein